MLVINSLAHLVKGTFFYDSGLREQTVAVMQRLNLLAFRENMLVVVRAAGVTRRTSRPRTTPN